MAAQLAGIVLRRKLLCADNATIDEKYVPENKRGALRYVLGVRTSFSAFARGRWCSARRGAPAAGGCCVRCAAAQRRRTGD